VLVGNISSGKTSMINYACKTNLPVGVGETTDKVKKVACSADNVFIWDSPGVN
jgi:predicted GTPase